MRVAVYFAYGNEADLTAVIDSARRRRCTLYLPAITDYRHRRIDFLKFDSATRLRPNRHGIAEPELRTADRIPIRQLDLMLVPLVAFDDRGWRVGSGAGFYDRALHHLRAPRQWRRPRLIGVGYELQRVARIEPQPWDVPLDGIVTERELHRPRVSGGQ